MRSIDTFRGVLSPILREGRGREPSVLATCTHHLEHLLICIVKLARWAGYMVMHSVCLLRSISFSPACPLRPLLLFVMELSIGDKVFYSRPIGLRVPVKVAGHLDNGHMELECQ